MPDYLSKHKPREMLLKEKVKDMKG